MQYIITPSEKRKQQNLIFQAWRFVVLSLKFFRLTCAHCNYPQRENESAPQTRSSPGSG